MAKREYLLTVFEDEESLQDSNNNCIVNMTFNGYGVDNGKN